jgi:hypothetical protein
MVRGYEYSVGLVYMSSDTFQIMNSPAYGLILIRAARNKREPAYMC